jgi:hypothetical protein
MPPRPFLGLERAHSMEFLASLSDDETKNEASESLVCSGRGLSFPMWSKTLREGAELNESVVAAVINLIFRVFSEKRASDQSH